MLAHIFNAALRALAVSLVFGCVLIYAVGGIDSPDARPIVGVIIASFFMFWVVFVFLFGPRVPKSDGRGRQTEVEGGPMSWARGRQREQGERGDRDGDDGDSGGGDGGGD